MKVIGIWGVNMLAWAASVSVKDGLGIVLLCVTIIFTLLQIVLAWRKLRGKNGGPLGKDLT